jgi:hypothetical protein
MSNNIILAKKYTSLLNEVYMQSACTGALESDGSLVREGSNAREIVIPSMTMDGMADYSRHTGFVKGNVNLSWNTVTCDYDRGRMFEVDVMDNEETQEIAFGRLAGEFIRTKAVPELDAYRFAGLAGAGHSPSSPVTITDGATAVGAIREGVSDMNDAEVPYGGRILFVSNTIKGFLDDMDTYKSKEVLRGFDQVIEVPAARFYTEIDLNSGAGGSAGGYAPSEDAEVIDFMIVHKPSIICYTKHAVTKIIPPDINPDADAWRYAYRCYGLCTIMAGKLAAVYTVSH